MDANQEIGHRLREFGEARFSSMAEFARALGVTPQNLNAYLSGQRIPGNKMEDRLKKLGCDLIWLVHGVDSASLQHRFRGSIKNIARNQGIAETSSRAKEKKRADREPLYHLNATGPVSPEFKKKLEKLARRLKKLKPEEFDKVDKLIDLYLDGKESK